MNHKLISIRYIVHTADSSNGQGLLERLWFDHQPSRYRPYLQAVEPYLAKCSTRFLCRDLKNDVREGDAGHLTVIIEFESLDAAKAAYEAQEYQELRTLRLPHSEISVSIIEEGDHAGH